MYLDSLSFEDEVYQKWRGQLSYQMKSKLLQG